MKTINLVDRNPEMCDAWKIAFKDCIDVTISCGDIFSLKTDCVVSPSNSFGFMDGGIDSYLIKKFGNGLEKTIQRFCSLQDTGEFTVGRAALFFTYDETCPFIIFAPTMRVPMILENSVNVYLASKAIFYRFKNEEKILTINISGIGTGVGQVPYDICARHMRKAYDEMYSGKYKFPESWTEAQTEHQLLYTNNVGNIQFKKPTRNQKQ